LQPFRSTASGFTPSSNNQIASSQTASLVDSGLVSATTYYYKVEAVDAAGVSPPSAQASATTPANGGGFACHVTYAIVNQWNSGFQAAITIQNTGNVGIANWTLAWVFPETHHIWGLWNGSYVQSGETVSVNSYSHNGSVPAGGS
jgi:hypothetical protein